MTALAFVALAAPAFADIPPPTACAEANAGQVCDNAYKDGKTEQSGVCQKGTCKRTDLSGMTTTYDCYLCQAKEDAKDGGCSTSKPAGNAVFVALPLLVAGLLWNRRRRVR